MFNIFFDNKKSLTESFMEYRLSLNGENFGCVQVDQGFG